MRFLNSFGVDLVDTSGNITPDVFGGLLALTILFLMLTVYFFKQNRKNKLELENLKYLEKHKNDILEALKKVKIDITYTTWEIIIIEIKTIIEESSKNNQFNDNLQIQVRCLKERVKQLESLNSNKSNNNEAKKISDLSNIIKNKDKLIEDKDKLIEDKDKQLKPLPDLKKRLENSQLLQDERLETIEIQKQEISSLEETIEIQKQEISSLEETIEIQKQDINRLEENIENQKQDINRLEETITNPNQDIISLEEIINDRKKEIVSLKKIINTKNKGNWKYKNKKLVQEIRYLRKLLKRKIMLWPIKEEDLEILNYFY